MAGRTRTSPSCRGWFEMPREGGEGQNGGWGWGWAGHDTEAEGAKLEVHTGKQARIWKTHLVESMPPTMSKDGGSSPGPSKVT